MCGLQPDRMPLPRFGPSRCLVHISASPCPGAVGKTDTILHKPQFLKETGQAFQPAIFSDSPLTELSDHRFDLLQETSTFDEVYHGLDVMREDAVILEVGNGLADGSVGSQRSRPRFEVREKVQGLRST